MENKEGDLRQIEKRLSTIEESIKNLLEKIRKMLQEKIKECSG